MQYGFWNIMNLGFVTDDWFALRPYYFAESPHNYFSILKYYSEFRQGANFLIRPYSATIIPFQIILFGSKLYFYHFVTLLMVTITSFIYYINLYRLTLNSYLSLVIVLLFISLPNHPTSYYWFSAQVTVFSLLLLQLTWYFLESSRSNILTLTMACLLFFLSLLNYETSISFVILYVFIIVYKYDRRNKILRVYNFRRILTLLTSILLFTVYRFILIRPYINTSASKDFSISHINIETIKYFHKETMSNLFGYEFFNFMQNQLLYFANLIDSYFLVSATLALMLIVIFFVLAVLTKLNNAKPLPIPNKYALYFGSLSMSAFCIAILFVTQYTYTVVGMGTRVNLIPTLGLSIFFGMFFEKKTYLFTLIFFFFSIINLISLGTFVKSYNVQLEFLESIKHEKIENNTLIVLDTNAKKVNKISALETVWGVSDLVATQRNVPYIEFVGSSEDLTEIDIVKFNSRRSWNYIFIEPQIKRFEYYIGE